MTRAAVWTGDGVDVRKVDIPELGEGDTLARVRLATVCGSDLHTVAGKRPSPCPSILGHEAVGEIVAGAGEVGQRIVWSVTVTCGRCLRCRSGLTAKCTSVRKVGHEPFDGSWALSGSYAQHIVLPRGTAIVGVPNQMSDAVAAPAACATATVMAALEAAGPVARRRVLIVGAGMLGVTAAAACARAGAKVQISDLDPHRLALAQRFGGVPDTGGTVDTAIDFSGASAAISAALQRLDVGGVLVLAGSVLPAPPVPVDPESIVRKWITITGVHNYEPRHLEAAVDFLSETLTAYPWSALVSEPVALEDIADVLAPPAPGRLRASVTP